MEINQENIDKMESLMKDKFDQYVQFVGKTIPEIINELNKKYPECTTPDELNQKLEEECEKQTNLAKTDNVIEDEPSIEE